VKLTSSNLSLCGRVKPLDRVKTLDGCFTKIRDLEVRAQGVPNFCKALIHGMK